MGAYGAQTFLNELCELKLAEVDYDIFIINQNITTGEYTLLNVEYNEEENYYNHNENVSKREKIINNYDSFKSDECVICLQEKPNILFCNCGHLCICEECEKLTKNEKCPVCRVLNTIKRKI